MAKTQTGSGLKLYINDRYFGIATGMEFTADPNRKAIGGLDQMEPFELAPTTYSVVGRIDCVRLSGDGGLEGRGVSAPQKSILFEKYISITLVDRKTDQVVFRVDDAAIGPQSWSIRAKRIVEGNFQFQGISWYNEAPQF